MALVVSPGSERSFRDWVQGWHDTGAAEALFTIMQWTIKILEEDRRVVEDQLFSAKDTWG